MAFQDQVEDLTSISISDTGELTQFLTDGVIDVTNRCLAAKPQDALDFTAVSAEQTGNGFDLNGAQIISVVRESGTNDDWRNCRKISPGMQSRVASATSIHYASKFNPAYMEFENGKISVFPDPGADPNAFKVYYVNNVPVDSGGTALAYDDTTIKNFPSQKIYLVIMYAGIRLLHATMGSNVIALTAVPPDVPTLTTVSFSESNALSITATDPTTISLTTIAYTDAVNADASATSIGAITVATVNKADISGDVPAYTKPIVSLSTAPTISNLTISAVSPVSPSSPSFTAPDISGIFNPASSPPSYTAPVISLGTAPIISDLSISAVSPVTPSLTSVTFTSLDSTLDANASVFSTATMGASSVYTGSVPTYTKPTLVLGTAPTISNLAITAVPPDTPTLSESSVTITGTPPVYTPPAFTSASTYLTEMEAGVIGASASDIDIEHWFSIAGQMIEDDEDLEMAQIHLQKITTFISTFQADMQNQLNIFNDANVEFQAKLQKDLQDAEFDNQEDARLLQKYQSELGVYQAEVSTEVQEYQQNLAGDLQVWQSERQTDLQKYSSDIQNELNEFNKENVAYQSAIQESLQELQVANGVNLAKAQADLQLATSNEDRDQQRQLQNGINDMQAIVQDNARKITLYQAEASIYQAEIGKEVQEYQQNLAGDLQVWQTERTTDLQKYGSDIQNELNTFNKANVEYQALLQQATQEVGLVLQKESQEYSAELQKYSTDIQSYQADVAKEVQEYQQNLTGDIQVWQAERQTDLQKYASDIQNELNEFNKENTRYQANIQAELAKHNGDLQKALTQAQLDATDAQQEATQATTIDQFNKSQDQVLDLTNRAKQLEDDISNNNSKVAQFQAEAQHYSTQVNEDVQAYTSQLQSDIQTMQGTIANNQSLLTKYQAETVEYQAEIAAETQEQSTKMQQYQLLYTQLKTEYDQAFAMMYPKQQQQTAARTA